MRDNDNILGSFQLHDDRFQANHNITIRFAAAVPIVELVLVTLNEVFRIHVLDFLVRHAVANASIELVEGFPLQLVIVFREKPRS